MIGTAVPGSVPPLSPLTTAPEVDGAVPGRLSSFADDAPGGSGLRPSVQHPLYLLPGPTAGSGPPLFLCERRVRADSPVGYRVPLPSTAPGPGGADPSRWRSSSSHSS